MATYRISSQSIFNNLSKAYLRYRQALKFSAAMQAAYVANHPDPAEHDRPVHEKELLQLLDLQRRLEGVHVDLLV